MKIYVLRLVAVLSLTLSSAGFAQEENLPPQLTLSNGETLNLQGSGLRKKLWIDIYRAGLYLPKTGQSLDNIMASPGANAIVLNMVYKEVANRKMTSAIAKGFEENNSREQLHDLAPKLEQFVTLFKDSAKRNDRYEFAYLPGTGTEIRKNDELLATISGLDFNRALLNVWLGNNPVDRSLKQDMLNLPD